VCCTVGWGGPGVEQWNGRWHSQPYWGSGSYCYNNQPYTQSDNQVPRQALDGLTGGVARTDQTPPPTQDTTPPPASVEDTKVHQPRIQQYCQTGYTTELPAVEHRPRPPEHQSVSMHPGQEGKLGPSVVTSYSEEKTAARQDTLQNPLPFNERGGPAPPSQPLLPSGQHTDQYSRPWETCKESDRPTGSPARKRRSRWEQPAGQCCCV